MEEDEHPLGDSTRIPLTNIHRLMKRAIPKHGKASKEAKQTVQNAIQEFIGFVTSEAKVVCRRDKRRVLGGDDIVGAMEQLGMNMYADVLKEYQKSYRKSIADAVENSDEEEGDAVPQNRENSNDTSFQMPDSSNPIWSDEPLDVPLPDRLFEIDTGVELEPTTTTEEKRVNLEEDYKLDTDNLLSDNEENCDPNLGASNRNASAVSAFKAVTTNASDDPPPVVRQSITIPCWTIPETTLSGIRVFAVDIPQLNVPVEVPNHQTNSSDHEEPATATAEVGPSHMGLAKASETTNIIHSKAAGEEDIVPSTQVADLVTPKSHVPLHLLDAVVLDPLDCGDSLGHNLTA